MNDVEVKFWHSKSLQFCLVWISFLGGVLILGDAYSSGRNIANQGAIQLGKFGSEALLLQASRIGITRTMPVSAAMILSFLSLLLGALGQSMIEKSDLPFPIQERILINTHLESLLIVTPILLLCAVIVSMIAAYFHSSYGSFYNLLNI